MGCNPSPFWRPRLPPPPDETTDRPVTPDWIQGTTAGENRLVACYGGLLQILINPNLHPLTCISIRRCGTHGRGTRGDVLKRGQRPFNSHLIHLI